MKRIQWFKADKQLAEVRLVEGPETGYPGKDSEDEVMYVNTHFKTREEAVDALFSELDAGLSLYASSFRQAQKNLTDATQRLAEWAEKLDRAKEKYQRSEVPE